MSREHPDTHDPPFDQGAIRFKIGSLLKRAVEPEKKSAAKRNLPSGGFNPTLMLRNIGRRPIMEKLGITLTERMQLDRELDAMRERLSKAREQAKAGALLSHDEVFRTLSDAVQNRMREEAAPV